jgi:hypothetical protein
MDLMKPNIPMDCNTKAHWKKCVFYITTTKTIISMMLNKYLEIVDTKRGNMR